MINGLYVVLINGVPKIKHKDAIDVSTPHALADLVAAVCSETEADNKITTHDGLAAPHSAAGFAKLTLCEVEVFNGTSPDPTAFTDLDLSGTVGANAALVVLRCYNAVDAPKVFSARPNGETEFAVKSQSLISPFLCYVENLSFNILVCLTDSAGIIEWFFTDAGQAGITIDLIGYIK